MSFEDKAYTARVEWHRCYECGPVWLCEQLREAVALLGKLPASHLPELNRRRDALLAELDEVTR